jgi:hypothetical protein
LVSEMIELSGVSPAMAASKVARGIPRACASGQSVCS